MKAGKTNSRSTSKNGSHSAQLRAIPSVDKVLTHPALREAMSQLPHAIVVAAVRSEVEKVREAVLRDEGEAPGIPGIAEVAARASTAASRLTRAGLRPVINATGVIIHTNLGRAPLSKSAIEAVARVAAYSNLEYDLEAGQRGSRYLHAGDLLRRVTGCEDALVVNNNAAALVLALGALAPGKEVVVSRGQLVEIGGGFRIPEIMQQSGATLVEVGTTNRTYLDDYKDAITPDTAMLMRIHASNFRVVGFTTQPDVREMAALAHEHGLLMVDDVGSGALIDTARYGLAPEPMVQTSLQDGADLVLFSGDKLLGGPQCGIITGKESVVARLKKHPLARALRVDKITLAALEATLLHYLKGEVEREVPVWKMVSMSEAILRQKAESWAERLNASGAVATVEKGESAIGGGSLPGETLPTWLVTIRVEQAGGAGGEQSAGHLAEQLRYADPPIITRLERGALLIDPRTVQEDEEEILLSHLGRILANLES